MTIIRNTTYTVTDLTTSATVGLRGVVGYWNGSARVAGAAGEGDLVILSLTGTQDLGGSNQYLVATAGVAIVGPGKDALTLQCGFYVEGSGNEIPTRLEGFTLDRNGNANCPNGLAVDDADDSAFRFVSCDVTCIDVNFTDADQGTSPTSNLLMLISESARGNMTVHFRKCNFEKSNKDCLSTKTEPDGTLMYGCVCVLEDCTGNTSGTANTDQIGSPHGGWQMIVKGGMFWNSTGGLQRVFAAGADSFVDAEGSVIMGTMGPMRWLVNCHINAQAEGLAVAADPTCHIAGNWIHNFSTGDYDDGIELDDGTATTVAVIRDNAIIGEGGGNGIAGHLSTYAGTVHAHGNTILNVRRGIDSRSPAAGHIADWLTGNIIQSSDYSILGATGKTNTRYNLVDQDYVTISLDSTDEYRSISKREVRERLWGLSQRLPSVPMPVDQAGRMGIGITANENRDAVWAQVIETGMSALQSMAIQSAAAGGKLSGAATSTIVIKAAQEGTTTRITGTVDENGNRSNVVLNLP